MGRTTGRSRHWVFTGPSQSSCSALDQPLQAGTDHVLLSNYYLVVTSYDMHGIWEADSCRLHPALSLRIQASPTTPSHETSPLLLKAHIAADIDLTSKSCTYGFTILNMPPTRRGSPTYPSSHALNLITKSSSPHPP